MNTNTMANAKMSPEAILILKEVIAPQKKRNPNFNLSDFFKNHMGDPILVTHAVDKRLVRHLIEISPKIAKEITSAISAI